MPSTEAAAIREVALISSFRQGHIMFEFDCYELGCDL